MRLLCLGNEIWWRKFYKPWLHANPKLYPVSPRAYFHYAPALIFSSWKDTAKSILSLKINNSLALREVPTKCYYINGSMLLCNYTLPYKEFSPKVWGWGCLCAWIFLQGISVGLWGVSSSLFGLLEKHTELSLITRNIAIPGWSFFPSHNAKCVSAHGHSLFHLQTISHPFLFQSLCITWFWSIPYSKNCFSFFFFFWSAIYKTILHCLNK